MSAPMRYECEQAYMVPSAEGFYVHHSDYAALQQQNATLVKALSALVALDDGDQQIAWIYSDLFNEARAALAPVQQSAGDNGGNADGIV